MNNDKKQAAAAALREFAEQLDRVAQTTAGLKKALFALQTAGRAHLRALRTPPPK